MEEKLIAFEVEEVSSQELDTMRHQIELDKEARSKTTRTKKEIKEEPKPVKEVFAGVKKPEELRKMDYDERMRYFEWCRQRDKEKVKGIFRNFESPGRELAFPYRAWKGDGFQTYYFQDGETYEVERGIARHLNTNCWYPEYEHLPGGKVINIPGQLPTNMRVGKKVRRFAFQVMDAGYDDIDVNALSPVIFVEHVSQQNITQR